MIKSLGLMLGLFVAFATTSIAASPSGSPKARPKRGPENAAPVSGQSVTLLPNGGLLMLGGQGPEGPVSTAAIKNPQTGEIATLPNGLLHPRYGHTATLLPNGTVFIFGGTTSTGKIEVSAELFDPTTQQFRNLPPTGLTARTAHTTTLLMDGQLIVGGGLSNAGATLGTIEAWDFPTNTATRLPSSLLVPRSAHTATLLGDGTVLFWGGLDSVGNVLNFGEIFDPATERTRIASTPPLVNNQPPQFEASLPQDQSTGVPVNAIIALRFSKTLNVVTVNTQTVTLSGPSGFVEVNVVPAEEGILAFITPTSPMTQGDSFTLSVEGAIDQAGFSLPATAISFTTVSSGHSSESSANTPASGDGDLWVPGPDNFQGNWKSGQGASPLQKLPPLQANPGVTALSGQTLRLNGLPLEGVTLQIDNENTTTDETGRFLLSNLTQGHQVLLIDGTTANKQGRTYGIFEVGVDVVAGKTTALTYSIWMTRLDTKHVATIPSPTVGETIVSTPLLPGLELHLPAGTVIFDHHWKVVTQVSITPVPIDQPPFPLPAGVNVPIYFTIQPGGAYINTPTGSTGARLYYPNSQNAKPGTRMDFWDYDADQKGWFIYGKGSVSADGKQIVPDPGVEIYEFTGAMVASSSDAPGSGPGWGCKWFSWLPWCRGGDPVDLGTGLFVPEKTDLYLPDVIPISFTRTYRQNDSASRAFGIGTTHSYDIFLVGDQNPYTYQNLVLADGSRIPYPRISSGTGWTDAVYQNTATPGPFFASTIVWNGNGWTLTTRSGTSYVFPDSCCVSRAQQAALLSITDRNGNTLTITRDSSANVTQIASPNGRWIQFTHDTNNRITQVQDVLGRTVQYFYDSSGRLNKVIDANGGTWQYNYDSNSNMTSLIDPRTITYLQNQYDSQNRVVKQTLADGASTYQFSYNPGCVTNCSQISETDVTDPNGNVEKVTFNAPPVFSNGFLPGGTGSTVTFAFGTSAAETESYQYQSSTNLLTGITDALNRTTSFAYDANSNTTSVTRLSGTSNATTASFAYDPKFSQLTSATDPLNHTTSFSYDSNGNLISATDALGKISTFVPNSEGQTVSAADPLGNTTSFAYYGGDLTSITDPLGRTASLFLDSGGRLMSRTEPLGQKWIYTYNALNQLTQVVDAIGGITSFSYDPNDNLLSVTDANGHLTGYTYDNMDRVATRKDALNRQQTYQYDGNGNLTQFTDRRGKVTTYTYDKLNRRTFVGFGKSGSNYESTINFTFDAGNRLTQTVDSVTGTISRTYDGLNRLTQETTPQGSVSYGYDSASRRTSMTAGNQSAVNYSYDNANRLTQITQGTSTVSFVYDAGSRRTSLTLPNGIVMSYGYDSASELTGISYTRNSNSLGNLTYSYDLAGRRTSVGGTYAATGLPQPVSSTAYDAANELTQWGTATPTYDANGNFLSDGTNSYVWNARNQLASMNMSAESFQYDPFGRRTGKTLLTTTTNYLYDGTNPVQELSGTTPTANLLTGGVDEYFQRTDSSGPANFLTDALGSTLALTNSSGSTLAQYTYGPFGNTTITGSSASPYQFTGRENDGTGIYSYRSRYYSPTLQRFVSEDPIGMNGGINLYAYVENNPVNFIDPFGFGKRGVEPQPSNPGSPNPNQPQPPTCQDPAAAQQQAKNAILQFDSTFLSLAGAPHTNGVPGTPGGPITIPTKPSGWIDGITTGAGTITTIENSAGVLTSGGQLGQSLSNGFNNAVGNCTSQ